MNWISNLVSRYWRNIHLSIIVVISLALVVTGSTVSTRVSYIVIGGTYYPFARLRDQIVKLATVDEDNQRLRLALVQASKNLSLAQEAQRENERLRSILGFEPHAAYSLRPAKVIAVRGSINPTSVVIDKGSQDSIAIDQPVINERGLVGRIQSVTPGFSTVQLLTDPTHRVAGRVAQSREMGIVRFAAELGLILDNLPIQAAVAVGDTIVTSGLGGIYPAGLQIGTVVSIERAEDEVFWRVLLIPTVNFRSLEELFILEAPISE